MENPNQTILPSAESIIVATIAQYEGEVRRLQSEISEMKEFLRFKQNRRSLSPIPELPLVHSKPEKQKPNGSYISRSISILEETKKCLSISEFGKEYERRFGKVNPRNLSAIFSQNKGKTIASYEDNGKKYYGLADWEEDGTIKPEYRHDK